MKNGLYPFGFTRDENRSSLRKTTLEQRIKPRDTGRYAFCLTGAIALSSFSLNI